MSSTQSEELLLQYMMIQYCVLGSSSVLTDMKKLREILTLLSDQQKLHMLQQKYSDWWRPLHYATLSDHTEIISTLLTSLQSSADRLKLLMVDEFTPLHAAAFRGKTESVKTILDCLTADQQIQIMSVQDWRGDTAIKKAERGGRTDTERVLREYQQRAKNLMTEEEQGCRQEKQREEEEMRYSRFIDLVITSKLLPVVGNTYNHTYHEGGKFIILLDYCIWISF